MVYQWCPLQFFGSPLPKRTFYKKKHLLGCRERMLTCAPDAAIHASRGANVQPGRAGRRPGDTFDTWSCDSRERLKRRSNSQQFMCRRALFLTVLHEFWELGGCTPPIHRPNAPPRRGERGISAASGQHAARRGQSRKKSQHVGVGNDHLGMCRQHARGAATP